MAHVNGAGPNGQAVAKGKSSTNADVVPNGQMKSPSTATTNGIHEELSNFSVAQNIIRKRPVQVTSKCHKELTVLSSGALSTPGSVESFLDFVAADRLRRMPHKGSRWDKILLWAEYFTTHVSMFHESVGVFVPNSEETAQLVWASSRILLQMGPQYIDALDKIFGVFYKMSLVLTSILRNRTLFTENDATQDQLVGVYSELLLLVVEITVTYQKKSRSNSSFDAEDLHSLFGQKIDHFFSHRDKVSNTIWECQLERNVELRSIIVDMSTIRRWLTPQDRTLRLLSTDTMNSRSDRADFTCEWFQPHLLEFCRSSEDMFLITGGPGSGKSTLASWTMERLEKSLGRKSYDVNSVMIDSTMRSESTSLSVIKRLLLQSLEQTVGNVSFYKLLCAAVEMSTRSNTPGQIENALWRAFDKALDVGNDTILVIDGLDQMLGGETVRLEFLDRLYGMSKKHMTTKCVVFSHPLSKPFSKPAKSISLQPKYMHDDLERFVYRSLASLHHFHDRKEEEKKNIVHRIVDGANGSFVLAEYIVQLLKNEKTHTGFNQALNNAPKSTFEATQKLVSQVDLTQPDTKLVLSWLLISERPLTLKEIQSLLETDVQGSKRILRTIDIKDQVHQSCGSLIEIRDGIIRFRNTAIRQHLIDLSKNGKALISLQDAHRDLTYRCLAYANSHLTKRTECKLNVLDSRTIDHLFETHHLLEYTTRYWISHFRSSSMHQSSEKHDLTAEFRRYFTRSVFLVQIEDACWESQFPPSEVLQMHQLALNIRKTILGETHEAVLQSLITIARTYERVFRTMEASNYYYQASILSQTILGIYGIITTTCAERYITCTSSITTTTRTEITNRREEMLKVVIKSHKHHHGHSSEEMIRYSKLLAQLYTEIEEIVLATKIYREVYEACVEHYGEFHSETTVVSRSLVIVLQKESRYEDILIYIRSLYEKAEESMDVIDIRRIQVTLRLLEVYEAQKELVAAEELIITLWRRIIVACHIKGSAEIHARKIEVTLAYVRFLRRQSRYVEAENILRGLWIEYEIEEIHSESLIIWIKAIGEEMNELRILDVAVKVFKTVWGFFKRIHKQHTVEATSVAILIAELTLEIRTQEEHYIEETTYFEETILKEVYESCISTITTTTITTSTIRSCETLSSFYLRKERYSEAIAICHRVLTRLWLSLVSDEKNVILPKDFTVEAIEMAIRIAHCYSHEHQIEKAEKIFVRLFRATKSSLHIQDELVARSARELILFYESTKRSERAIEVYRELWEDYSCTLGATHTLTIETLYRLGELSIKHRQKDAEGYYLKIYVNLDHDFDMCHHGAIEAALALTRIYESEKRWTDAQKIYAHLWRTILVRTREYKISSERVDEIYRRYFYILEKEVKVAYTVLRQTTIEFREVCIHVFGARAEITLRATLRLAEINERSEKHIHEAIEIYEETFKETQTFTKTTTITTIITTAKSRLTRLYVTHSHTSTTYTSKAVTLCMEEFESYKAQLGCSHERTLLSLEELAVFYKSRKDQKLESVLLRTLQSAVIEIVVKEKDSRRLCNSSRSLARIYGAQGYTNEAYKLLEELRRQIVSRDTRSCDSFGFKIDQQADRRCFIFLAAYQETLRGAKDASISEIMASFLTETALYDAYTRSLAQKTRFETTMVQGARLRYFRRSKYHDVQDSKIDEELFEAFLKSLGSSIKTNKTTTRYFFNILLEEIGKSQHEVHLVQAGCGSGTTAVHILLEQSKFQEAVDLANCIWQFTQSHHGFHDQENISTGFKLALYLANRGAKKCPDQKIQQQMLGLSRTFLKEILEASRQIKVDFTKTPITQLNELVTLLGEVQDFADLEWILTQLWESRHTQSSWSFPTIIQIGRRLVEVRFSHGSRESAIHVLEDICYNLRRVWFTHDRITYEMHTLLAELYTSAAQFQKAMGVHEKILKHIVSDDSYSGSVESASSHAHLHLELLRRAHQRLGRWGKDPSEYSDLVEQVVDTFHDEKSFAGFLPIGKWSSNSKASANDGFGAFKAPSKWELIVPEGGVREHLNNLRRISGSQRWESGAKGRGVQRVASGLHTFVAAAY